MAERADVELQVWHVLIASGLMAMAGAAGWWLLSRPSGREVRTAELTCTMLERADCAIPQAAVAGPVVLAVVGGFAVLIGVLLRGQATAAPRT